MKVLHHMSENYPYIIGIVSIHNKAYALLKSEKSSYINHIPLDGEQQDETLSIIMELLDEYEDIHLIKNGLVNWIIIENAEFNDSIKFSFLNKALEIFNKAK